MTTKLLQMRYLFLLIISVISLCTSAQDWLKTSGGLYNDEAWDVEQDASGNIFSTGYVTSVAQFGAVSNVFTNGGSDIYVAKSDPNGNFLWVKVFGGPQADRGYDIELDNAGNIYVTGFFSGTANFDGTSLTAYGSRDAFVLKLDPAGNVVWVKADGGVSEDVGYSIAVDVQGNVICTGQFKGPANIGGSVFTSMNDPITGLPSYDGYIVKYGPGGVNQWEDHIKAPYDDRGLSVDTDLNNNIYLAGQFSDTLSITGHTENNDIFNAGFVLKLNTVGTLEWFRKLKASQTLINEIEIDGNQDLWVTGNFQGTMELIDAVGSHHLSHPYTYSLLVIKLDANGDLIWMEADGSESEVSSEAIAFDSNQDAYISGTFKCIFDEYRDTTGHSGFWHSVGFRDVFIAKYQNQGGRIWQRQYGGPRDDFLGGIATISIDNPIIAGGYHDNFTIPLDININFPLENYNYPMSSNYPCQVNVANFVSNESYGERDIFLGKPVNLTLPSYYYFDGACFDSTEICVGVSTINSCSDSVEICYPGAIGAFTNDNGAKDPDSLNNQDNFENVGPFYHFNWNIGATDPYLVPAQTGLYICEATRIDGCSSQIDSVFATVHYSPDLPAFNDDLGVNINQLPPLPIITCEDSVGVWMSFIDTNLTTTMTIPGLGVFSDSIPHYIHTTTAGGTVSTINEFGCFSEYDFQIIKLVKDTISPYLMLFDEIDFNDSIKVCHGDSVLVSLYDSITNPTGDIYDCFDTYFYDGLWTSNLLPPLPTPNLGPVCAEYEFIPDSSAWYVFNLQFTLGWPSDCDTTSYSVIDSFFVEVLPKPFVDVSIFGDSLLCPSEDIELWIDSLVTGFSWQTSGTGSIMNYSSNGDTITVNTPGGYFYGGMYTDTTTGCSGLTGSGKFVIFKPPPTIVSNVPDNLICPNDSILLTCVQTALEYQWIGPTGILTSTTQSIWVNVPGEYFCTILDQDSCHLVSNTIEIFEYSSPFLVAAPDTEICLTGSADLTAIHSGNPSFNWLPPINSNSSTVTVTQPGVYVCEITQCGFTVTDSVEITQNNVFATNTALTDTIICPGDTAVLIANSGMSAYEWNVPNAFGQSLLVTDTGAYTVTVYDIYGCSAISNTIHVSFIPGSEPPVVNDTILCAGDTAFLSNTNGQTTYWYSNNVNGIPDAIGPSLVLPNVQQDTTVYVESTNGTCTTQRLPVFVDVSAASQPFSIFGDTTVCLGDSIILTTSITESANYQWNGPDGFSSNQTQILISTTDTTAGGYYSVHVSDAYCYGLTDSLQISIVVPSSFQLSLSDTVYKCFHDSINISSSNGGAVSWQPVNQISNTLQITTPGLYYATQLDTNGCTMYSDSLQVNNYLEIVPNVSDTTVCYQDSVQLSGNGLYLDWFDSNGSHLATDSIFQIGSLLFDTLFWVTHTDTNGCISLADSIDISVIPANGAPNIYGDTVLCEGENLVLWTDQIAGAMYNWSSQSLPGSNSFSYSQSNVQVNDSGPIQLQVSGVGCITSVKEINLVINPLPAPPQIIGDSIYCEGDTLILVGSSEDIIWVHNNGLPNDYGDTLMINGVNASNSGGLMAYIFDSLSQCISTQTPFPIVVLPAPMPQQIANEGNLCIGDSNVLFVSNPLGNMVEWTLPDGSIFSGDSIFISQADTVNSGKYLIQQVDNNGCIRMDSTTILFEAYPLINLGPDQIICEDSTILIEVDTGYYSYLWQDGSTNHYFNVSDSGTYHVSVETFNGCLSSDSIDIDLINCQLGGPNGIINIITPNGDGSNDYFVIENLGTVNYLIVYNRWGRVVYETANYKNDWNGGNLSDGVYYYLLYPFGKTGLEPKIVKGFFHLFNEHK